MQDEIKKMLLSYHGKPQNTLDDIITWVDEQNNRLKVSITKNKLSDSSNWFYDEQTGEIRNQGNTFFKIRGLRNFRSEDNGENQIVNEQPILVQDEIGYLGIICKEIAGMMHFLMQAKIEPGNVNKIQISPTVQATKSNFMQKHGGRKTTYIDYFLNADKYTIIFDQIQSEQSSRFWGKRNRNIMIKVDEDIEVLPNYIWITLKQLKELMKIDNLVNMDTRTVLSCIPYYIVEMNTDERSMIKKVFRDKALFESIFAKPDLREFVDIYRFINEFKMLHKGRSEFIPLRELQDWEFSDREIIHKEGYAFKVIFADIEIEGREVTRWMQPLVEAMGMSLFGLISADFAGKIKFLVHALPEVGCFDGIELAPSVQLEVGTNKQECDVVTQIFLEYMKQKDCICNDVILSEEGGRFYCEQNRNVILRINASMIPPLPKGYFWVDYCLLDQMVQYNNVLNIQLRNLLSIIDF